MNKPNIATKAPDLAKQAYEQGWRDAIGATVRALSKTRDKYLSPKNQQELWAYKNIQALIGAVDEFKDFQTAQALIEDQE